MKTPLDTSEIAGLVQSFMLGKNIKIARCDALELAARIKGMRDLHADQAATEGALPPLSNADARLFFQMMGIQMRTGLTTLEAVDNAKSILPSSAQWLPAALRKGIMETGSDLPDLLRKFGFPAFISSIARDGARSGDQGASFTAIAEMLEKAEQHLPSFALRIPPMA